MLVYRFGQLAAGLHDAKAQGNDLCGQQEIDYFLLIGFYQSTWKGLTQGINETLHFWKHEQFRFFWV